jgi:hypothetical protein
MNKEGKTYVRQGSSRLPHLNMRIPVFVEVHPGVSQEICQTNACPLGIADHAFVPPNAVNGFHLSTAVTSANSDLSNINYDNIEKLPHISVSLDITLDNLEYYFSHIVGVKMA